MTSVHLLFSVRLLNLFVVSLVFMKGTSCSVIRRVEPLDRAMAMAIFSGHKST